MNSLTYAGSILGITALWKIVSLQAEPVSWWFALFTATLFLTGTLIGYSYGVATCNRTIPKCGNCRSEDLFYSDGIWSCYDCKATHTPGRKQ